MAFLSKWIKNQKATYWEPKSVGGGYAKTTFSPPSTFNVRWQDKRVLFRSRSGEELVSTAIVFLTRDVLEGGYLLLGISSKDNPKSVRGARMIQRFESTTDLMNRQTLRKAIL